MGIAGLLTDMRQKEARIVNLAWKGCDWMAETQKKMGRPKGSKDKKPRKTDGYKVSNPQNAMKARAKSPIIQDQKKEMPPGYNSKMVKFIMDITPTEPLDYHDVDEMERRFLRYLQLCAEQDVKVGNLGAYLAIGITKRQAYEWENARKSDPRRSSFIQKVRQICGYYREGLMQDGKVNPVTGIFWQKNYDGLRDQTEMVITPNNPLGDSKDVETLKQKYLDVADIIDQEEIDQNS